MHKLGILILAQILIGFLITACASTSEQTTPERPIIVFDTDFGGDADDLGAIAVLHHFADQGIIDFKAIMSWSNEAYALPALSAVNGYYGRPDLPVGVRAVEPWRTEWNHTKIIADQFPHDPDAVENAVPAVTLYRRILAEADTQSVTIVTVGPLANIRNLLLSPPDTISSLSGQDLFDRKVKAMVVMGGQFPDGVTPHGIEWNFDGNMPGVTRTVLETVKRPIVFSGFEVGAVLRVGSELNDHPRDTPLYVGYKYFSEHAPWMKEEYQGEILDNSSFDQTAVIYAAISGVGSFWTLSEPGTLRADDAGKGYWQFDPDGAHRYLIVKDKAAATDFIAEAMTHIPNTKKD